MKLETKVKQLLEDWSDDDTFDVYFHEMWRSADGGWEMNDSWRGVMAAEKCDIPAIIRDRWEVIAVNYGRKRVGALEDIGYTEDVITLESDHFPIAELRRNL